MADMVFILDFLHCLPKYLVCIFSNFKTYNCIMACFTFSVLFKIGADLKTTSIWKIKLQFTMVKNFSKKSNNFQRCERSEQHLITFISCLFTFVATCYCQLFVYVEIGSCNICLHYHVQLFVYFLSLSAVCLLLNYQYQLFVYIFAKS